MVISQYSTEQCSLTNSTSTYETNNTVDIDDINRQNTSSTNNNNSITNNNNVSSDNLITSSPRINNNNDSVVNSVNNNNKHISKIVGHKLANITDPSTGCKSQSGPPSLSILNDDNLERQNSIIKNSNSNNNNCTSKVVNSLNTGSKNCGKFQEESYEGFGYARIDGGDGDVEGESPGDEGNCSTPSPTHGPQAFGFVFFFFFSTKFRVSYE